MSRSTSQSSATAGNNTNGLSRSLSLKTNAKSTAIINPLLPSDTRLFVTNLRLLDLDQKPDWPTITVQTFSSRNADQKQRIGGVEWALFRLFEIWDPEETSQKLQPFFPPLEPLQSLNLRAALYRCLNELKKNGVLGRESVLRKTMLDECKGEKFFEVLTLFSTAVLKKVLSQQQSRKGTAIARKLSMATVLSRDKQASLLPLAIAHKAALVNVLRRKDEKRRRFAEFEGLLNAKAAEIHQRIKHSKTTPRAQKNLVPEKEAAAIKKQLKDSWIGPQTWLDTMLHGDDVQVEDAFLNQHFSEFWPMVEQGRRIEDAAPEIGLLEDLQLRVQEQHMRLQKWKKFHEKLRNGRLVSDPSVSKHQQPAKEFKFDGHLKLQLNTSHTLDDKSSQREVLRPEYQELISDMDDELLRVSKAKHNRSAIPQLRRTTSSMSGSRSPVRRKKSRSDSLPKKPASVAPEKAAMPASPSRKQSKNKIPPLPQQHSQPTPAPLDSEATLIGHPSTTLRAAQPPQHVQNDSATFHDEPIEETSDPLPTASSPSHSPVEPLRAPSPSPLPSSHWPSEPPVLEAAPVAPEDALAEQIISSIGNATPSPIKQSHPQARPSLAERTRMSMARQSIFNPVPESPTHESPSLPDLDLPDEHAAPLDRRTSLLDRTRLSMAAMSQNPRPQPTKDKRKSSARQSLFPVNQFDTPRNRKSFQAIEEAKSGGSTPKEDLFSDDIDYERVFKSRPRIAQSPVFSPAEQGFERGGEGDGVRDDEDDDVSGLGIGGVEDYDEGVTGVDLADVDADDEDGFTKAWENSPLRGAGGKGKGRLFG